MNLLFLGDSITDCGHCFTTDNLGNGYVKMIHDSCAGTHQIINGGTDGAVFPGIFRKWKLQYRTFQSDIVSILGGINEVGALMDSHMTDSQTDLLLLQSSQALYGLLAGLLENHVPLILLPEPFLFPYPSVLSTWMPSLYQVRHMIRQTASSVCREFKNCICHEFSSRSIPEHTEASALYSRIILIPLQPPLDIHAKRYGYSSVTSDGIHLTQKGHEILCECLMTPIETLTKNPFFFHTP